MIVDRPPQPQTSRIWNGPRYGYNPRTKHEQSNHAKAKARANIGGEQQQQEEDGGMDAEFSSNTPAQLFWRGPAGEDVYFGELAEDRPLRMHTFAGHTWVLKNREGVELKHFKIESGMSSYGFA